MNIKKIAVVAVCLCLLTACGSSKDKARELLKSAGLDKQYELIVNMAAAGYSSRYPTLQREQIRQAVRDNLSEEDLQDAIVELYADHFDDDELELMIQANRNPQQAMAIILGSKNGRDLAQKVIKVQQAMAQEMQAAMASHENAIIDALDDLRKG